MSKEKLPIRKCLDCGLEAFNDGDLEPFVSDGGSRHGKQNLCRVCASKRALKWYRENRVEYNIRRMGRIR